MKPTYRKSWAGESSGVVTFDLESLLQGETRSTKLTNAYNSLIITPRGWNINPTYRKSFDLESLLQGETRSTKLTSAYNSLIITPRGGNVKPTYRKSRTRNLLV